MKPPKLPRTARELYRSCLARLAQAGIPDAAFEAQTLLQHVAGRPRFELDALTSDQEKEFEALILRRIDREPLQYLLGSWSFMGLDLAVGPGVLIPRPETEQVCLAALEKLAGNPRPTVLELCAGSGAMALAIQDCLPEAMVTAVELDTAAYHWLERNVRDFAQRYTRAPQPVQADALDYHRQLPPAGLDLIVCNPPYVDAADYNALEPELFFEPRRALAAPEQGYFFYRRIARDYASTLKPGGWLVFELGAGMGPAVAEILRQNAYAAVEIRPDYAGHDRIALAQKPL